MPRHKKSSKRSARKDVTDSERDLTVTEVAELEELKAELTDSLDTSSSSNSSSTFTSGDGIVSPTASHSSLARSKVLSSSAPSSPKRDKSIRASCSSSRLSVKSLVAGFQSLSSESIFINMELREELEPLSRSRAGFKSHVTRDINHLNTLKADNNLNINLFKRLEQSVTSHIQEIERKDIEISAVYDKHKIDLTNANRKADSDATAAFILNAHQKMSVLETDIASSTVGAVGNVGGVGTPVSNQDLLKAVSQVGSNPIKVSLECGVFNGDEKDKFEFHAWLSLFETIIKTRPNSSEEFKISYLKSKVRGNADAFIAHLDIVPGNYQPCIDALKAQYLDEPFLIDEYFTQILNDDPMFDEDYGKTSQYLATTRNKLHNLKSHYKVDLVTANTGGNKLLSHIVFSKLSGELRKALIAETKSNYPIFDHCRERSE